MIQNYVSVQSRESRRAREIPGYHHIDLPDPTLLDAARVDLNWARQAARKAREDYVMARQLMVAANRRPYVSAINRAQTAASLRAELAERSRARRSTAFKALNKARAAANRADKAERAALAAVAALSS